MCSMPGVAGAATSVKSNCVFKSNADCRPVVSAISSAEDIIFRFESVFNDVLGTIFCAVIEATFRSVDYRPGVAQDRDHLIQLREI